MAKKIILSLLLLVSLVLTGCTIRIGGSSTGDADGGIWKSVDSGETWEQVVAVPMVEGQKASISNIHVRELVFDPQDANTLYLASEDNGLFYTYDAGKTWQQFSQLKRGRIDSIAVDPSSKCMLYVTAGNKLFQSVDCGRSWKNIYFHPNSQTILTDVLVSHGSNAVIYLGTSVGDVIKSSNQGGSWSIVYNIERGVIADVLMDSSNSDIVYVATTKKGIYKTIDNGRTWASLGEGLKSYTGSHEYQDMVVDSDTPGGLILITKYGMLRSRNYGDNWDVVNILPSSTKSTILYSVAVNPKASNEIYYTTRTSLVKTIDGGQTWSSQKLPFSRIAKEIAINPDRPNVLYLGAYIPQEDGGSLFFGL